VQVRVSALLALRLVVRVLRLVVRVLLQLEQVLVAEPGLQSVARWLKPLRMLRWHLAHSKPTKVSVRVEKVRLLLVEVLPLPVVLRLQARVGLEA
jgi:hypothetical protein